jgi:hypothetical protein
MGGGPFLFVIITYYCHFGVFVLAAVFSNRQQTVSLSLLAPISSCRVYHVVMRAPIQQLIYYCSVDWSCSEGGLCGRGYYQ